MNESNLMEQTPPKPNKNRLITFNETFDSSILDKPERFILDKTLVKGIKQNDSSKIIQNGEEADIGEGAELYDQYKEVSDIFVNTRKKYDQTKQTVVKVEQRMDRLKKQKQIFETQKVKIQLSFSEEQKQLKSVQSELQKLNDMCEAADYAKDVRLQMSDTLRQDILFYKKNSFEANIKIVRNGNRIKTLSGQYQSTKKVSNNCKSLIYSIQKKITSKQSQRYDKISSFNEIINKKVQNNIKRQERQKMIEQSMMEALNGKMPEQQEQKKLLMVNLALKKLLKLKMESEMEKYNQIETTFRKIKQNTTVKRADEFIQRFIHRQKNYGELLESISKNEDKINQLKSEKQTLEKQQQELMFDKQTIDDLQNEKKELMSKENVSKIDILREKLLHNERLKNKTFSLISKFLSSYEDKNIEIVKKQLDRQKPNLSLRKTLERVNTFLDLMKNQQSQQKLKEIYIESKNLALPSNIKVKNLRIKTITTRDENQNSVMEDHDIAYDDLSERQYLNQNRKQIKKSTYLRNRIKTRAY